MTVARVIVESLAEIRIAASSLFDSRNDVAIGWVGAGSRVAVPFGRTDSARNCNRASGRTCGGVAEYTDQSR